MQDIKQQLREEFVSKLFGDFNLPSGYPSKEKIADWWLNKLNQAIEQERKRIIDKVNSVGGIGGLQHLFDIINNK